ncbi:MAG: thymidine phosphorylase, partial [Candidatus Kerfeldbacteria bacterium]|nr:thymidine phosphorylase [Candidatus Kerfeldbacteria bacterium]
MPFYLRSKKLRIASGGYRDVVLHPRDATNFGLHLGDRIRIRWDHKEEYAEVGISRTAVKSGELGLFEEVWKHHDVLNKGEIIEIDLIGRPESIVAINKKMLGGKLSDQEIRCIIKDVVSGRLSDMEIAYFMGSGFFHPFS